MNNAQYGNEPAFPNTTPGGEQCCGLTVREWFAGMAMQGIFSNPETDIRSYEAVASLAFKTADAIIAESNPMSRFDQ